MTLDAWTADLLQTAIENAAPDGVMEPTDFALLTEHLLPRLKEMSNGNERPYSGGIERAS